VSVGEPTVLVSDPCGLDEGGAVHTGGGWSDAEVEGGDWERRREAVERRCK
jgi:hypothetical protein